MQTPIPKIHKGIFFPLIVSFFFGLIGCLKEEPEELPFFSVEIKEHVPLKNRFGEVLVRGEIGEITGSTLTDYGFIWSLDENELFENPLSSNKISLRSGDLESVFEDTFYISRPGNPYYFRAFGALDERMVFSERSEEITARIGLKITEAEVFNNEIRLSSIVDGIKNWGEPEEYGYVFSSDNTEPKIETDNIIPVNQSVNEDLVFFDTLKNLDFNTDYHLRLFAKQGNEIFYGQTKTVQIKDGWKRIGNLAQPNVFGTGVSIGDRGYIGWGSTEEVPTLSNIDPGMFVLSDAVSPTWQRQDIPVSLDNRSFQSTAGVGFEIEGIYYRGLGYYVDSDSGAKFYPFVFLKYDPAGVAEWERVPGAFPAASREGAVSFVIDGKAYIGGGSRQLSDSTIYYNDFYRFDPHAPMGEQWMKMADLPFQNSPQSQISYGTGRRGAWVLDFTDRAVVGGGSKGGRPFNDFWEFLPDDAEGSWTLAGFFPGRAREFAASFNVDDEKGIVACGFNPDFLQMNDVWEYDKIQKTWNRRTALPGPPRYGAVGFSLGDFGYVGTGRGARIRDDNAGFETVLLMDFWQYTPLKK